MQFGIPSSNSLLDYSGVLSPLCPDCSFLTNTLFQIDPYVTYFIELLFIHLGMSISLILTANCPTFSLPKRESLISKKTFSYFFI